jgi:hypothetical protein
MERQRRIQEEKEEEEGKAALVPMNRSIQNVFKGLRKESGLDNGKEQGSGYPRGILDRERGDIPIDLEPAAPPPSRRSSCDSISTTESGESGASSSMSSVQSALSKKQSTTGANQKPLQRAVPAHALMANPVGDVSSSITKKQRRPRRVLGNVEARTPLLKQDVTRIAKAASSEPKSSQGSDMARSMHAVKAASGTKPSPQCKPAQAKDKTLVKRSSKHAKEQLRRDKKPRSAPAPAAAPIRKENLIDL